MSPNTRNFVTISWIWNYISSLFLQNEKQKKKIFNKFAAYKNILYNKYKSAIFFQITMK